MPLEPKITSPKKTFFTKQCAQCDTLLGESNYLKCNSPFYKDGYLPMCKSCIKKYLIENDFSWDAVDRMCQCANIPFIPAEFERLKKLNGENVFEVYSQVFVSEEYERIGWKGYFEQFKKLKENGFLENELPGLAEEKRQKLQEKWGKQYDDEALVYLENLLDGILKTQNVNGALAYDQALKICRMSYLIDSRGREGGDYDKLLGSYDKLIKTAEFTPKNVRNLNDFDTTGELLVWLEKRGFKAKYYDNVTRDVVDETMKNIEASNRRLYVNESNIGEEITRRAKILKETAEAENYYTEKTDLDIDNFEVEGYNDFFEEEEEFEVGIDE